MSGYIDAMANVVSDVSATDGLAGARKAADHLLTSVIPVRVSKIIAPVTVMQSFRILYLLTQEKLVRDFLIMSLVKDVEGKLMWKFNLPALRQLIAGGGIREVHFNPDEPCHRDAVFIYGQKSDFVRESDRPAILKLFPNSTFHCLPDAGHYLHVEKQAEFLTQLCTHVK